jgi:hypothetical protein
LYLGLKQKKWLFLSCHNYWVVCRLVNDENHPFLAYSPMISIEGSTILFRAFLGAILSEIKEVRVDPSTFDPHMELDTIAEQQDGDPGPLCEDDITDGSGPYRGSSSKGTATESPLTRRRTRDGSNVSDLMVHPSSVTCYIDLPPLFRLHCLP